MINIELNKSTVQMPAGLDNGTVCPTHSFLKNGFLQFSKCCSLWLSFSFLLRIVHHFLLDHRIKLANHLIIILSKSKAGLPTFVAQTK